MSRDSRETLLTALYIIAGLAGAIAAGRWIVGPAVFSNSKVFVAYAVAGFSGALVYAAARLRGLGFCILMIVLMFFGQVALNPPLRTTAAVIAALWALPVGLAFTASGFAFRGLRSVPFGKFLLMAVFVGIGYALGMAAYLVKIGSPIQAAPVLKQLLSGMKVGGLAGIGMELVDLLGAKLGEPSDAYY